MNNGTEVPLASVKLPLVTRDHCSACKFFVRVEGHDLTMPGECHRMPPTTTLFLAGVSKHGPEFNRATTYAMTNPDGWCGEHKPKLAV
jgi:hypothetical protein